VHVFGLHFASIDIRREVLYTVRFWTRSWRKILPKEYPGLGAQEKMMVLASINESLNTTGI
jgi:hypothetical protein